MSLDTLSRPCSECGRALEISSGRGRPRLTCSARCRAARSRRKTSVEARDRLREFERLLREEGSVEQQRAYADLIRTLPGFRETNDRALRCALDVEQ